MNERNVEPRPLLDHPGTFYTVPAGRGESTLRVPSFADAAPIREGINKIMEALNDAKGNVTSLHIDEGPSGDHGAVFSLEQLLHNELDPIPGLLADLPPGRWEFLQMAGKWRGHRMNALVGDQLTYPE